MRSIVGLLTFLAILTPGPAQAIRTWVYHPEPDLIRERDFAYAVDGVHREAYRFGGTIDGIPTAELKRQDLDDPDLTWHLVTAAGGPPARSLSRFFHDARRNRLLLLGGYDADTTGHADVWAFDLATNAWSQPGVGAGGPAAILNEFPMTYDSRADRLLYLNAQAADGYTRIWALDLPTLEWSSFDAASSFKLNPKPFPNSPFRTVSAAAYDSSGNQLFLQGAAFIDVLFRLDLSQNPSAFEALPGSAFRDLAPRLAVDPAGNRLVVDVMDGLGTGLRVLHTRDLSSPLLPTSWSTDYAPDWIQVLAWAVDPVSGTIEVPVQSERETRSTLDLQVPRWSSRAKTSRLRASDGMAGAIDPAGRAIYVYGGSIHAYKNDADHTTITDDALFRLDADDPTQQEWLHPAGQGPGPLRGAVAVLDSIGRRIVFLGGADSSGVIRSEVWALDMDPEPHWSQLATQSQGPARVQAGAAIDPVSRTLYLIGGASPGADPTPGLLWSLDLSQAPAQWNLLLAADPGLGAIFGGHIGYDRVNHRLVGVDAAWKFTIDLPVGGAPIVTEAEWGTPGMEHQLRGGLMGAFDAKRNLMFTQGGWYSVMTVRGPFATAVWSGTEFRDNIAALRSPPPPASKGLAIDDPLLDRLVIVNGDRIREHGFTDFDDCVATFGAWTLDLDDAVPAVLDLADVALEPRGVRVRFSGAGADGAVRVERSIDGTLEWTWIGDAREVSPELYEWIDDTGLPGTLYRYRARYTSDGAERITATSEAVLIPGSVEFALRVPGGAVGQGWPVVFEGQVRPGTSARVELVDVAGRVVSRREVTGAFRASLAPLSPSAGIYFARLIQGERKATIRLVRF